jgi:hypothetical protein
VTAPKVLDQSAQSGIQVATVRNPETAKYAHAERRELVTTPVANHTTVVTTPAQLYAFEAQS